ncbi:MAG: aldo/keto reductase [Gemmatimonadales bacterium]
MTRLAHSDLDIFPVGLGGNVFGMTVGPADATDILDAFVAGGGNFIDTADSYSAWVPGNVGGESETMLGVWMRRRGNRRSIVMATKVAGHPEFKGLAPKNIARAADASLQRLQTDYIDVYYAHHDDPEVPVADVAGAFDRLVEAGKVRYVGISNLSPERIDEWMRLAAEQGLARPVALQPQYSLVSRKKYEETFAPLAERHRLSVVPYFALASGFLTGKYRTAADLEGAARAGGVSPYLNADGLAVVDRLRSIAASHRTAVATVALAWALAKPGVTAPLASATSAAQLAELMAVPELALTGDEIAALDEVSLPFA